MRYDVARVQVMPKEERRTHLKFRDKSLPATEYVYTVMDENSARPQRWEFLVRHPHEKLPALWARGVLIHDGVDILRRRQRLVTKLEMRAAFFLRHHLHPRHVVSHACLDEG